MLQDAVQIGRQDEGTHKGRPYGDWRAARRTPFLVYEETLGGGVLIGRVCEGTHTGAPTGIGAGEGDQVAPSVGDLVFGLCTMLREG